MTEETAQLLRDWLAYWNEHGHSTGLRERTEKALADHASNNERYKVNVPLIEASMHM